MRLAAAIDYPAFFGLLIHQSKGAIRFNGDLIGAVNICIRG
jgi:hypothetical protein